MSFVIEFGKHDFGGAKSKKCIGIWLGFIAIYIYYGDFVSDMAKIKKERDQLINVAEMLDKETVGKLKRKLGV